MRGCRLYETINHIESKDNIIEINTSDTKKIADGSNIKPNLDADMGKLYIHYCK